MAAGLKSMPNLWLPWLKSMLNLLLAGAPAWGALVSRRWQYGPQVPGATTSSWWATYALAIAAWPTHPPVVKLFEIYTMEATMSC